jgi:hypothetical protein
MREREARSTLGISRRKLAGLIGDGVLYRTRRGVVVGGCIADQAEVDLGIRHDLNLRTLLLSYENSRASHESSARLLGLPLLELPRLAVVTRERGAWRGGPDTRVRVAPIPDHHRTVAAAAPCLTAARTFVDIARTSSLRHAVIVGDGALRQGTTLTELHTMAEECSQWSDVGKVVTALAVLDPRAESALESLSRVIMHEHKVPPPETQVTIRIDATTSYRLDFFWRAQRVVGEADGLMKYTDPDVLRAEKVRQEDLERKALTVVRWTWRDMLVDTEKTIGRLRNALG